MILNPTVIANLLASLSVSLLVVPAAAVGVRILQAWNLQSGSELQLALERRTYLVSTVLSYACGLQLLSLFLYVFTANALHALFVGAMCAAGTLYVNPFGYPTLLLKIVNFTLAGLWLLLNHADEQAPDYPLIRAKYAFLVMLTPFVLTETVLLGAYFLGMRPDVITSCCGRLFSTEATGGLAGALAALPTAPMVWGFYGTMALTLAGGVYAYRVGRGSYLYTVLAVVAFLVSLVSIITFISVYIYEMPTHHCPFCLLMREYGHVGYVLYFALFGGLLSGSGIGVLTPFRNVSSLQSVIPPLVRKLTLTSVILYAAFTVIVSYRIAASELTLWGGPTP